MISNHLPSNVKTNFPLLFPFSISKLDSGWKLSITNAVRYFSDTTHNASYPNTIFHSSAPKVVQGYEKVMKSDPTRLLSIQEATQIKIAIDDDTLNCST